LTLTADISVAARSMTELNQLLWGTKQLWTMHGPSIVTYFIHLNIG